MRGFKKTQDFPKNGWVKNDDFDNLMSLLIEEQKMLSEFIRMLETEM